MNVIDTAIFDVKIIEPTAFGDERVFCVISEHADYYYKCTDCYSVEAEVSIRLDDIDLDIHWSLRQASTLSSKDSNA